MKFIFVGGCARSGTTLLQKILLSHSKISGGSEFYFGKEVFTLYRKMTNDFFLKMNEVYYDKERAKKIFHSFYSSFLNNNQQPGTVYISEKTPTNIEVVNQILEVFPESIYINVIRDGRDVVSSYLDVGKRYRKSNDKTDIGLINSCNFWLRSVKQWSIVADKGNTYNIMYEDLIREPEVSLKSLMQFINLEFEQQMLKPEKISAESVKMQSNEGTAFYSKQMMMQPFNKKRIGVWRKNLSFIEKIYVNIALANQLINYNYQVAKVYYRLNRMMRKIFLY